MFYLNADRSAIVPTGSPEAAFGIQPKDMKRLGYDKLPTAVELGDLPEPEGEPRTFTTANLAPEPPEEKEADKPANKAAKKPANKSKGNR